jgi:hypothetical protein
MLSVEGNSEDPMPHGQRTTGMSTRSKQQLLIYIRTQLVGIEHFIRS